MVISDSTPPAERARKSQLSSETSERSAGEAGPHRGLDEVAGQPRRHAGRAEPRPHRHGVPAVPPLAPPRAPSTGTFLAMAFMRAMACAALSQRHAG